ncbi:AmmeMemoRadiSam system protein B [Candidatus Poribacteria bacterium]|nr:MAG: AmmeMemoRadiSam system protein B [Candidatus Poribacteria bacterium]
MNRGRGRMAISWKRKAAQTETVRSPAVAGSFYPDSPKVLSAQVGKFIDDAALHESDGTLIGLIAPHAGYVYSGHVAGYAYKQLMGQSFDTVVLLGLSHRYRIDGAAIYARGAFRTPLGNIQIDEDLAAEIMRLNSNIVDLPPTHANEHSLEVQLPFLQYLLSDFRIVPILLQDDSPENVVPLSQAIAEVMSDRFCLLIGSTDLCHYPTYEAARKSDQVVIEAIEHFDSDYLRQQMDEYMRIHPTQNFHCMMCSTGAIYTTMRAAKALGGNRLEVLKSANSGDVPIGGRDQVVGYMAVGIYR